MVTFFKEHLALTKWILASFLVLMLIVLVFIALKSEKGKSVRRLATIAIFSALSYILYYVKIPYPVFSFLDIQFSNVPAIITGLLLGPASGVLVVIIRTIIKIPFTSTFCVGEIADLVIGTIVVLASAYVYKTNKTKKNAVTALVFSGIVWVGGSILLNYLFLLPAYMRLYFGLEPKNFIYAFDLTSVFKGITEANYMLYYIFIGVLPFNLILASVSSAITFLVYKRISKIYHKEGKKK